MKKIALTFTLLSLIPLFSAADQIATTGSLSTLQNQLDTLNQQINNIQQNLTAVQSQSAYLKQQIKKYGNTDTKQFKWIDITNNTQPLPANIVIAAKNQNTPLHICQAYYANSNNYYGGTLPSTLIPGVLTQAGCVITYNGQAYLEPEYAVLTSNTPGYWINGDLVKNNPTRPIYYPSGLEASDSAGGPIKATTVVLPNNQPQPLYNSLAIVGGQDNGTSTYICRVNINHQYFIGKNTNNTCYIATGSYEANWPLYEVLLTRQP